MATTIEQPSTTTDATADVPPATDWTLEDMERMLDEAARLHLGISGETFRRRWESGAYAADPDAPGVQEVRSFLLVTSAPSGLSASPAS
jgi:hypothetical protein